MSRNEALDVIRRDKGWWRPDVYRAFLRATRNSSESDRPESLVA